MLSRGKRAGESLACLKNNWKRRAASRLLTPRPYFRRANNRAKEEGGKGEHERFIDTNASYLEWTDLYLDRVRGDDIGENLGEEILGIIFGENFS